MFDVVVIGAGPAGVLAALRAGDPGATTALVTGDQFGGMASSGRGNFMLSTFANVAREANKVQIEPTARHISRNLRHIVTVTSNWIGVM